MSRHHVMGGGTSRCPLLPGLDPCQAAAGAAPRHARVAAPGRSGAKIATRPRDFGERHARRIKDGSDSGEALLEVARAFGS
jgi:hypothetical protein